MIRQTQEQKADKLWQGYPTGKGKKNEEFWQAYEGLLSQEKKYRQIPTKQQWQEKYYYSSNNNRLNTAFITMFIELLVIILFITQPTTLAGYLFATVLFIAVTVVNGAILFSSLFYFAVSDSGLYFKDSLIYKGVSIAWESIDKITFVTEQYEDLEQTQMVVRLKNGRLHKALDTHYDLSKVDHRSFIKHLNARQIPHKKL